MKYLNLIFVLYLCLYSCKKDTSIGSGSESNNCISNIEGLWEGTFTSLTGFTHNNRGYYFSLSIFRDKTCSYKSETDTPNFFIYGEGTWTLTNNEFTFNCKTINNPDNFIVNVKGSAVYNKSTGSLNTGQLSTISPKTTASWKMEKVK